MNNEAEFKTAFCNSIRKQKGYTFRISMAMTSGLPDLYCVMPGYVPLLLEAKFIKDFKNQRKIPYTKLQSHLLIECNKPNKTPVAFGLIGVQTTAGNRYCMLINPGVQIVTFEDLAKSTPFVGNHIDVDHLFYWSGVAKM